MKKSMDKLKEIMGVEEQSAEKGTSKELLEIKRQIKSFTTVITIIMAIAIICFALFIISSIGMTFDYFVSNNNDIIEEIYFVVRHIFSAAAVWYMSVVCKNFCKEIDKADTPFIPQVPKGLRKIAAAIIVMIFADFASAIVYSVITDTELVIEVHTLWWAFISILMLLSSIFDYGCKLQKESDETL